MKIKISMESTPRCPNCGEILGISNLIEPYFKIICPQYDGCMDYIYRTVPIQYYIFECNCSPEPLYLDPIINNFKIWQTFKIKEKEMKKFKIEVTRNERFCVEARDEHEAKEKIRIKHFSCVLTDASESISIKEIEKPAKKLIIKVFAMNSKDATTVRNGLVKFHETGDNSGISFPGKGRYEIWNSDGTKILKSHEWGEFDVEQRTEVFVKE